MKSTDLTKGVYIVEDKWTEKSVPTVPSVSNFHELFVSEVFHGFCPGAWKVNL